MSIGVLLVVLMLLTQLGAYDHLEEDVLIAEHDECHSIELSAVPLQAPSKSSTWSSPPLDVYHFDGFQTKLSLLFIEVHLQINLTDEQSYQIYQGSNCSSMLERHESDQRLFGLLRYASIMRSKHLNPFGNSVVGISTYQPYVVRVRVWEVNYMRVMVFVGAVLLFVLSRSLVRNALVYYASGCCTGYVASLLIVAIILYRFTPKRWVGIPILFGGWSLSFYLLHSIYNNLTLILLQYQRLVAVYIATVTLLSLAVCYRYGPPTDVRSHNLAQWTLQIIALILVYFSCQIEEIAFAVIVLLVLVALTKGLLMRVFAKLLHITTTVWTTLFPKSRQLLSMQEYEEQGERETAKALDQLRVFCKSPDADVWRITSSLKHPKRFARFVDGSRSHVLEEESMLHDLECSENDDLSDDSGQDEMLQCSSTRSLNRREQVISTRNSGVRHRGNKARTDESLDSTETDSDHLSGSNSAHDYNKHRSSRSRLLTDDSESHSSDSEHDL